ncbi:MAG: WbqC family protein [Candidatus Velthaea sp.]|jgi:hypothetical protein
MQTVAIIQPYFVPYGGYFRLFAAADLVVMFDCVQFPRRGWVHRNRLPISATESDWLTLPVSKCDRETTIADLRFPPDARERLEAAFRRFPLLAQAHKNHAALAERVLAIGGEGVAAYLCELVAHITHTLGLNKPTIRSSELGISPDLHGQDRIIAIARHVGATRYINPSGGRELYDAAAFAAHDLELRFLTPYGGVMDSILARLLTEPPAGVAAEIVRESVLVP